MTTTESKNSTMMEKQVFTTGEAAELCSVSQQTIIRCFDQGRLDGFRVPGSKFRRIPRESLLRFMQDNGIPTPCSGSVALNILVICDDSALADILDAEMASDSLTIHAACTAWDAGACFESTNPDLVIVASTLPSLTLADIQARVATRIACCFEEPDRAIFAMAAIQSILDDACEGHPVDATCAGRTSINTQTKQPHVK